MTPDLEGLHFVYLSLGVSAAILLAFALRGMERYGAAWCLAFSAPAGFLWPFQVIAIIWRDWPAWQTDLLLSVLFIPLLVLICPLCWVGPIVFIRQYRDLKRGNLVPLNIDSLALCAVLVALHVWADQICAIFFASSYIYLDDLIQTP